MQWVWLCYKADCLMLTASLVCVTELFIMWEFCFLSPLFLYQCLEQLQMKSVIGAPHLIRGGTVHGPVFCTCMDTNLCFLSSGTISLRSSSANDPCRFCLALAVLVMEQTGHAGPVGTLTQFSQPQPQGSQQCRTDNWNVLISESRVSLLL